ncbi:MAG TPA: hypothetical protein VM327_03085 [Candidatus Thermoplasmatota archaeon]|nr:hypothetical protein [Candidatus Thermoplasmatota archaeon]
MRQVVTLVVIAFLAGCSDPAATSDGMPSAASPSTSPGPPLKTLQPAIEVIPFSFDGNLGTFVHGCVFPVGQCTDPYGTVVEGETDLFVERPGANLTALAFEMTWQAKSPATQELWVGAMVMTSCDGCNDTGFPDAHGPSPLALGVKEVMVPLTAEARVHIYVYNPKGFVYDPAVPAYGGLSLDEPFHIEGNATVLLPPAA